MSPTTVKKPKSKVAKKAKAIEKKPKIAVKKTSAKNADQLKKKKSFFTELFENVEQGAKIVSEKTSLFATDTYEKVKKGAADAIDVSSQVVTELYSSASDYTEQFKDKIEMKKLNNQRSELTSDLGRFFYKKYKVEKVTFSKFSKTKEFTSLLKNIENVDREIVELGERLSK